MSGILRFFSRISFRLLVFNILIVFLPAAGFLFLDTYESQLLKMQEDSMVQQGRLLSASLSRAGELSPDYVKEVLVRLEKKTDARLRVIDEKGKLIADSSSVDLKEENQNKLAVENLDNEKKDWLYELAILPVRIYRRFFQLPLPVSEETEFYPDQNVILGPEVKAALDGKYSAVWRFSAGGQRSVTLFSALPIQGEKRVIGAVLVSQSTYKILQNLYLVRLDIFKIFAVSVAAAIIISIILSWTIARPLRKLSMEAGAILDRRGRLKRLFFHTRRKDEIGELTRALEELTRRLEQHISFIESFASDLSHEFKNPLAAIRSAIEVSLEADERAEQEHFLEMALQDLHRMEQLLTGAREISRLDTKLKEEALEKVNPATLLTHLLESFRLRTGKVTFNLRCPENQLAINASTERLSQVFENILDNAVSFSPENSTVEIVVIREQGWIAITVTDQGPGIPEENIEHLFNRFFSFRPGDKKKGEHTGLGLSIAKAIIEGYGGTIQVKNKYENTFITGACFSVKLPAASIS